VVDAERNLRAVDHYQTLQVTRDADAEVVERAYKALSLKYHPDHAPEAGRASATVRMQAINAAYSVLRDSARRRAYDDTLPPLGSEGWERFWEAGLFGLFMDRFAPRTRSGS
jgi:DnaJ-class molecular chaperone